MVDGMERLASTLDLVGEEETDTLVSAEDIVVDAITLVEGSCCQSTTFGLYTRTLTCAPHIKITSPYLHELTGRAKDVCVLLSVLW